MAIPRDTIGPRQIELVRMLLQRGADVNKIYEARTATTYLRLYTSASSVCPILEPGINRKVARQSWKLSGSI